MEKGQWVKWQNTPYDPEHIGKIVAVIPNGIVPTNDYLAEFITLSEYRKFHQETTTPRDHVSYIVANKTNIGKIGKPRLMWPKVHLLNLIGPQTEF